MHSCGHIAVSYGLIEQGDNNWFRKLPCFYGYEVIGTWYSCQRNASIFPEGVYLLLVHRQHMPHTNISRFTTNHLKAW